MAGQGRPILGIDINPSELIVVEVQGMWPHAQVLRADSTPMPAGAMEGGRIADVGLVAGALRELLNRMHVTTREAVMGLPTRSIITRTLDVPRAPTNEMRTILQGELAHYQVLHANTEAFDFIRMESGSSTSETEPQVLVMAAEDLVVNSYCEVAERAGLRLIALEPILLAMYRASYPQLQTQPGAVCIAISYGDIEIALVEQGSLRLYRRLDISSSDLVPNATDPSHSASKTEAGYSGPTLLGGAEPEFDLTNENTAPAAAQTPNNEKINMGAFNNLAIEMKRSLDYYQREYSPSAPISYAVVATNHPELNILAGWFADASSIETAAAEPPIDGEGAFLIASPQDGRDLHHYIGAIGLGMHQMANVPANVPRFNLSSQQRYEAAVAVARKKMTFASVAAVACLLILIFTGWRIAVASSDVQHQLVHLRENVQDLQRIKQQKIDSIQAQVTMLHTLSEQGVPFPRIMDALARSVDPNAGLVEIDLNQNGQVGLTGEADDEKTIIRSLVGLKRCSYFQDTALDSFDSTQPGINQTRLIRFQITSQLAPAPQQPAQTAANVP